MIKVDILSNQYHNLPDSSDSQALSKLNSAQVTARSSGRQRRASYHSLKRNLPSALTKSGISSRVEAKRLELPILQWTSRLKRSWRVQVRRKGRRKGRENFSLGISDKLEAFKLNLNLDLLNFCIGELRQASALASLHQTSKSLIGLVVFVTALLSTLNLMSLNANAFDLNPNSSALPVAYSRPIANLNTRSTAPPEPLIRSQRNLPSNGVSKSEDVLVQTKMGIFRGIHLSSHKQRAISDRKTVEVVGFLGIRYASAPIKRLRFMPPTAYHYAPNQVHNMQQYGPICRQRWPFGWISDSQRHATMNSSELEIQLKLTKGMVPKELFVQMRPLLKQLAQREQSEDCLNLNIYQPVEGGVTVKENSGSVQTSQLLPVLVLIHGESFDYGAGSTINGPKVAKQGHIIVITFNFRLNILGFPPKLTGASRGNLGLMDQVAALHWIKDNIGSFGGSPNNITLMGTKKGAIFVNLLMLSPMAKGLFHAAIMEDGSALTPFVANHIAGQQSVAAVQHVRLLAKLCDCPLHQLHISAKGGGGAANATSTGTITGQQPPPLGIDQQQQQLDETKMNALTFECLRHKPIDQLLLPIPLELLHLSAGQLTMEQRWLRNLTATNGDQAARTGATNGESSSHYDQPAGQTMVPVDANLLARLVEQANREQLALLSISVQEMDRSSTSELFSAIYLQQSQVRPLFGPYLDGTIVPDEDLATAMLKPNSLFAQRHLLIGLTQPMLSPTLSSSTRSLDATSDGKQEEEKISLLEEVKEFYNQAQFELRPEHMMADLITIQTQRMGLSNEQAVDMVNKFVRSFYRYHNQEITNSIINNYLSRSNHKLMRMTQQLHHQQEGQKSNNPVNQQSLLLLDSLLEAFQDALTNVPVLKTSLIHASRQLDPVAEVFVAQQFERLRMASITTRRLVKSNDTQELLESFVLFAQSLFHDFNWPLELKGSMSQQLPQAKSTYLYQFETDMLVNDVKRAIQRMLDQKSSNSVWKSIREILYGLLIRLQGTEFRHKLGFGYVIRPMELTKDDSDYIYPLFTDWLSERLTSILVQFIKTGKMNHLKTEEENQGADELEVLKEKVDRIESKCLSEAQDHHLVQAVPLNERNHHFTSETCRRELNALAFDLITYELTILDSKRSTRWPVFNLFSQQVATLPPISTVTGNQWLLNPISGGDNQYDQKSSFFARSSFWSNFVPALNCSKTQPINPSSLLTNPPTVSTLNSSLLHLNLAFSCSLGGRTSYGAIESIVLAVRQSLETKLEQWTQVNRLSDQQQNHHNLRMANISSSLEVDNQQQLTNNKQEASQMTPTNDAGSSTFDLVGTNSAIDLPAKGVELRTKYAGSVLVVCGVLIATTLVSGACAIAKQRKRARKCVKESIQNPQQQPELSGQCVDHLIDNSSSTQSNQHQSSEQALLQANKHNSPLLRPVTNQHVRPSDEQYLFHSNSNGLAGDQLQQEAETSFQDLSQQPLIYWNHQQAHNRQRSIGGSHQELFDPTVGINLCKSHSMLKISNNGLFISTPADNYPKLELCSFDNSNNALKQQEPIMAPIQDYPNDQANEEMYRNTIARVPPSCIANGGGYADSSSETQGQLSSVGSISKKRVKISEPIGMGKRNQQQNRSKQNRVEMVSATTRHNQESLYCPMHSDQVGSRAEISPTYFIEDTFLQPSNIDLWNSSQLNEMNLQLLNQQQISRHHSTLPTPNSILTRDNCDNFVDHPMLHQNDGQIEPPPHHQNYTIATTNCSALNNSSKTKSYRK